MKIKIISPETTLYEGEVKSVKLVGLNGKFEILNNHAPIVSALTQGDIIMMDMQDVEHVIGIKRGLLEMSDNNIQILAQ